MTKQAQSIQPNAVPRIADIATTTALRRKASGATTRAPAHAGRARPAATDGSVSTKIAISGHADAEPGISARTTKQETVLTLLSRGEGASIEEIMVATGWQQHSVRGFFAGTVKKKLGFNLVSSRDGADARRYRIETGARRGTAR